MIAYERRIEILKIFQSTKYATIEGLASRFDVSKDSIYRDLRFLRIEHDIRTQRGVTGVRYVGRKAENLNKPGFYVRREKILEILKREQHTTVRALSEVFRCNRKTIMRDISWLSGLEPIYTDYKGIHYKKLYY